MTEKETIVKAMAELPEDATIEDAMERLLLIAKVQRAMDQLDAGQGIPHEEVQRRLAKWLP